MEMTRNLSIFLLLFSTSSAFLQSGVKDIPEVQGREWTSARDHTSVIRISPECPAGHAISLFLKSESASFSWTPDTRYGKELLYQAIQPHRVHLYKYELQVDGKFTGDP